MQNKGIRGSMLLHETHLIKLLEQFPAKYIIQVLPTNLDFYGSKQFRLTNRR